MSSANGIATAKLEPREQRRLDNNRDKHLAAQRMLLELAKFFGRPGFWGTAHVSLSIENGEIKTIRRTIDETVKDAAFPLTAARDDS